MAVANHEKAMVLDVFAWIMPLVGFLLALFVYPALLAADSTAKRLKEERARFELKLPEDLRMTLLVTARERFLGNVPTFAIPVMLAVVWGVIMIVLALVPLTAK